MRPAPSETSYARHLSEQNVETDSDSPIFVNGDESLPLPRGESPILAGSRDQRDTESLEMGKEEQDLSEDWGEVIARDAPKSRLFFRIACLQERQAEEIRSLRQQLGMTEDSLAFHLTLVDRLKKEVEYLRKLNKLQRTPADCPEQRSLSEQGLLRLHLDAVAERDAALEGAEKEVRRLAKIANSLEVDKKELRLLHFVLNEVNAYCANSSNVPQLLALAINSLREKHELSGGVMEVSSDFSEYVARELNCLVLNTSRAADFDQMSANVLNWLRRRMERNQRG